MNDIGYLSEKGMFKTVMSSNEKSIASTINDCSATSCEETSFQCPNVVDEIEQTIPSEQSCENDGVTDLPEHDPFSNKNGSAWKTVY